MMAARAACLGGLFHLVRPARRTDLVFKVQCRPGNPLKIGPFLDR